MKKNILLVEYAASTIDTIKEILSHPIFDITVLNEGDTAKNFLTKKKFDMLITAAMLPKFHGFSLSLYASTHSPGIKIIIISEIYKGMDYKHQAISQYKAHDFFEKPLDKNVFKKRVLELLGINENDLMQKEAGATTAIQTPVPDTKKIPTLKKIREDKDRKILSSEDIFGDIIKGVQEVPPFEIKLEENKEEEKPKTGKEDAATQLLDKTDIDEHKALKKTKIPTTEFDTRKIDMDLDNLMKTQKIVKEKKETQKFKKIEDDISKKFEETLSGLGIGTSDKKPILKDTRPIKIPEPPEAKPPSVPAVPVEIAETKEKRDEVGGYEILGPIARGGMAEIYKAKKKGIKGFEKMIALKKILSGYGKDDKYVEMFVDEAKIAAELTHPNIVQIYDLGKKDDYYFIAMEYVAGKDLRLILRKLMDSKKLFPEELSLYLILEVLKALNYAHSAKNSSGESLDIVHRDISPPNILVSFSGDVKLTDFGVSKASIKLHQTIAGALKGKLLYMSPEQARGDKHIDYRSDLYSVGIILFELITGQKLFMGTSEMAVLRKVQKGEIIKPSQLKKDIDPELETFILKMLNKDMNKRYQKASDIINDLQAYINKNYTHAPTPTHLSYAIYNLFEEEIKKEGIKIDLKPIPYEIKRVKKEAKKMPEEEPLQQEEEVVEALEENMIELEEDETIKEEIDEKPIEEEEFQPLVEIDFADNDLLKEEPVKKRETEEVSEPELIQPEFTEIEEEFHKKKKYILISLGVIIILGALIAFYLIIYSAGEKREPFTLQKPGITDKKPGRDSDIAATDTDTGTDIETESRQPVPKVETEVTYKTDMITKEPQEQPLKPLETTENLQSTVPVTDQVKKPPEEEPGKREQTPIKTSPEEELEKETEKATPEEVQKQLQEEELLKQKRLEEVKSKVEEQKKLEAEGIELKEGQILSITEVDTPPVAISTPPVEITQRDTRIIRSEENVFVSYLVDHNGNVESVRFIRKSSSKKINVLIEKTISGWKFKPAVKNNIKVKVWKTVSLTIKK